MAYEDFNINLKDQLLIKYYVIKHFILYLAQYDGYQKGLALMADKVFDGGSATCEDKSAGHTSIGVIKSKLWWITEELKNYRITEANYRNDLQEPAIEKKKKKNGKTSSILHHLKTTFWIQI